MMDLFTGESVIVDYGILIRSDGVKLKQLNDGFISYKHYAFHFPQC